MLFVFPGRRFVGLVRIGIGLVSRFAHYGREEVDSRTQIADTAVREAELFGQFFIGRILELFQRGESGAHEAVHGDFGHTGDLLEPAADGVGFVVAGFSENIDFPAKQLGGELDVLPLAADGAGELIVRHGDFEEVFGLIDHNAGNHGRSQRVAGIGRNFGAPDHNVDAFAVEFLHDVLDAGTAHANAGAHGIGCPDRGRRP